MPRPTQGSNRALRLRGCHPLRPAFPDRSTSLDQTTGLLRFRSPLLAESLLMSFPPGTEMFQFPGFASRTYVFSTGSPCGGVSPFGHPRINDRSHLPAAFRSVPRPSSPPGAKASTERPYHAREPIQHRPRAGPNRAWPSLTTAAWTSARPAPALLMPQPTSHTLRTNHLTPPPGHPKRSPSRQGGQSIRQIRFTVSKNTPTPGQSPGGKLRGKSRTQPTGHTCSAWRLADSNR